MNDLNHLFGKCPHITTQQIFNGKWALIIMHFLKEHQVLRFNELHRLLPGVTQASLTKQLRSLEEFGIVIRKIYPEIPPKVEYKLSLIGKDFEEVLTALEKWGNQYIKHNQKLSNFQ